MGTKKRGTAGDYYDRKAEQARLLSNALEALLALPRTQNIDETIRMLRRDLETARFVGD